MPITGAMVVLLDARGRVAASTLTDEGGRFATELPSPGRYRARIDRIGYESLTTDLFNVPAEGAFRQIRVPVRPVELSGLKVSASKRCRLRSEAGKTTVTVWEEARKALEAAAWTVESNWYHYTLLRFSRRLNAGGKLLTVRRRLVKVYGQLPYGSRPAHDLADSGYVRKLPNGKINYFAPDADVLLSDAFLDTHCMHVEAGQKGLIGLAFEPVGKRALPDIRGVLWLNEVTGMLTRLDFRYVHLLWGRAVGDAGGEVTFDRLPAGTWIVRDWYIRMPLLEQTRRGRYDRTGYSEGGGAVWRAVDRSGSVVWRAPTATVSGQVTDSLGNPLAGAIVTTPGVGRTVTDSAGKFVLAELPGGHLVLNAAYPFLDTLGMASPDSVAVDVRAGGTARVRLRVPGVREVLAHACSEGGRAGRRSGAILLVRVRDGDHAAAGATVRLGWLTASDRQRLAATRAVPPRGPGSSAEAPTWKAVRLRARSWLETTLDGRGVFLLCDVSSPSQVRVWATSGERAADVTVDVPRGGEPTVVNVTLRAESGQQAVGVVRGRVLDAKTGEPVSSATVSLIANDSLALVTSWTDSVGRFGLPVLDSGTFTVRVERLGYDAKVSDPVRLNRHDTVEVEFRLIPAPILLDSVLVSVRHAGRRLRAGEQLVYGRLLDDDTHDPIPGGTLRLLTRSGDVAATARADAEGRFWLISPRAGTYRLQGARAGYRTAKSPTLYLMLGDSIGIDFYLSARLALPSPITVTATRRRWSNRADLSGMEGFFSRYARFAQSGYGEFMIRDSIAYWDHRGVTVGDMLLARIHAVRQVVPLGDSLGGAVVMTGGLVSISRHIGPGGCIPRYYLDGAVVPYQAVSGFAPQDLEAVEVYVWPRIPAEFNMGSPCGVVVYWRRRSAEGFRAHATIWTVLLLAAAVTGTLVLLR